MTKTPACLALTTRACLLLAGSEGEDPIFECDSDSPSTPQAQYGDPEGFEHTVGERPMKHERRPRAAYGAEERTRL